MVHQHCHNGDIIMDNNNQCGCVVRCNVLGFTNGYIVMCFDGPNESYPHKCAVFESTLEEQWNMVPPNITGTIDINHGATGITGIDTNFTQELVSGDKLIVADKQMCVNTVISNTFLTLTTPYTGVTLTNANLWKL